jgi:hypothetical protein
MSTILPDDLQQQLVTDLLIESFEGLDRLTANCSPSKKARATARP